MSSAWTFPAPACSGEQPGRPCRASAAEICPLEQLEPKVLMMLEDELRDRLAELQPGAVISVGLGPGSPYRIRISSYLEWGHDQ